MTATTVPTLKAAKRKGDGSNAARGARGEGKVPAQVYGHKKANTPILLDEHELDLMLRGRPYLVKLEGEGANEYAIIKEVQRGQFNQGYLHVDFQRVNLDEPVDVRVSIEFLGTPAGNADGGRLEVSRDSVRLRVRANNIPAKIVLDVSGLELGKSIEMQHLPLPQGSALLQPLHWTVCSCKIPRKIEIAPVAPAAGAEGAAAAAPGAGEAAKPGEPAKAGEAAKPEAAKADAKAPAAKK